MNYLLDTHFLVWLASRSSNLSQTAIDVISDEENYLWFSAASLWEVAIKAALRRPDFRVDVGILRAGLLANGYTEIAVEGRHMIIFRNLPAIHKDPFDRLLVAQAQSEGLTLLTIDAILAGYGGNIKVIPKG